MERCYETRTNESETVCHDAEGAICKFTLGEGCTESCRQWRGSYSKHYENYHALLRDRGHKATVRCPETGESAEGASTVASKPSGEAEDHGNNWK